MRLLGVGAALASQGRMSAFSYGPDDLLDPFAPAQDPDGLLEPDWAAMEPAATADVLEAATVEEAPKAKKKHHHHHKSKLEPAAVADVLEPAAVQAAPKAKKKHHHHKHKAAAKADTSLDTMIAASTAKFGETRADYDSFSAANPVANYAD
jgi:hypothetical protein